MRFRDETKTDGEAIEMTTYKAANGQEITEEMIARWNESYDGGRFPVGERTVGTVVNGRPPVVGNKTVASGVEPSLSTDGETADNRES